MKTIVNLTKKLIVLTILLLSSCTTSNKVACPSFGKSTGSKTRNYTIGIRHFTFNNPFTLKKDQSTKQKRKSPDSSYTDTEFAAEEPMESDLIASNDGILSADSFPSNSNSMQPVMRPHDIVKNDRKSSLYKPHVAGEVAKPILHPFFEKKYAENQQEDSLVHEKSKRKKAVIKGIAIILLAILAGIFLPLLGTFTASIGLVAMLLLDIVISIGIIGYYKKEKPKLAKTTGFLRILYSAIFGLGIGYHIAGNLAMFNKFWSFGLIAFGFHLIALGILFNNEGGKKWVNYMIKALLIIAGIGYILLNFGVLLVPNPIAFTGLIQPIFVVPQILAEVLFALWMLLRGGKKVRN